VRTTVRLDPEVAAAAEQLRHDQSLTMSAAVNQLARAGLAATPGQPGRRFVQQATKVGLHIDVSNVAEALDLLDGPDHK